MLMSKLSYPSDRGYLLRCRILYLYKAYQQIHFSFWIYTLQGSVQGLSESPEKVPSLLIQFQKLLDSWFVKTSQEIQNNNPLRQQFTQIISHI